MRPLDSARTAASSASPEVARSSAPAGGIAAALLVAGLFVGLAAAMQSGATAGFDQAARQAIQGLESPATAVAMRAASRLGSPPVVSTIGIAAALLLFVRGRKRAALLLPIAIAGGGLLSAALKHGFQRARPSPMFDYQVPSSYSFPSGHAVWSFCLLATLAALLAPRLARSALRAAVWIAAGALILLVGLSRVYFGVHHPSDVLAGWAAALVWTIAVAGGDRLARSSQRRR